MSRFYASIQGERGEATRQGHRKIYGHVRGWRIGVEVSGYILDDADTFEVRMTGGSGHSRMSHPIATVRLVNGEPEITFPKPVSG